MRNMDQELWKETNVDVGVEKNIEMAEKYSVWIIG
jgi:hypothetical protein